MNVDQARLGHQANDPYWSADLVASLEDRSPGLAFYWALECMKGLLDNTESPRMDMLRAWVMELEESASAPQATSLMARGQEIWHEERDLLHTAMAQLYAAKAYRAQGDSGSYRLAVIRTLNLMGDHEFYRSTGVTIPLALYRQILTKPI